MLRRLFDLLYAPVAAAMLLLLVPPFCLLVIAGPTPALRRELGRLAVRLLLLGIGVPLRVRGREHLPQTPCIIVSNHVSYLDGLVLTAALPRRYTFVVQDGAARWPLIGLTLHRMGVEFVDRSNARSAAALTRMLIRRVAGGESFTIFPEGTFKEEPGLLPFKKGAFLIAARAGVPVVPVVIRGTRRVYGEGRSLPRWSPIDVEIFAPLAGGESDDAALALRDRARAVVLAACGEPDRAPAHQSA